MNLPEQIIYQKALEKFGHSSQILMSIQEMSELTKELTNFLIGRLERIEDIPGEIADVEIMLNQLKLIFDCGNIVKEKKEFKLKRLEGLINNG